MSNGEEIINSSAVTDPEITLAYIKEPAPVLDSNSDADISESITSDFSAEPVVETIAVVEPVAEPVVETIVVVEPVAAEPVVAEPVVAEPVVAEPVVAEPVVAEPVAAEPVVTDEEVKSEIKAVDVKVDSQLVSVMTFIKTRLSDKQLTIPHVITLFAEGAKYMETFTELSGAQKKNYLISAIKEVSVELGASYEELALIDLLSGSIVDSLIDLGRDTVLFVKSKAAKFYNALCFVVSACAGSKYKKIKPEVTPEVEAELEKILSVQAPITKDKIIVLLVSGIKFLQESGKFNGASKKAVVIKVLHKVIDETVQCQEDNEGLHNALNLVGSEFIDIAVGFGQDVKTFVTSRCL